MTDDLNNNPLSELFTALKTYLDLRIDEIKLSCAEHMAKVASKFLYFFVMLFILSLAFGFFCVWLSRFISSLTNSAILGPIIIFGMLICAALIIYLLRNRLFLNKNIRIFIEMFFGKQKDE